MGLVPKTMDFRLKLFLQKVLSVFPYKVYRTLVNRHPKLANPDYERTIKFKINNCGFVKPHGLDLEDKVILETGTGSSLSDPLTFYLAGASKIYTFDIKLHLNPDHVWGLVKHYENNLKYLSTTMQIPINEVKIRWKKLKKSYKVKDLDELLRVTNIHGYESQIIPNNVKNNSVDIFFSNSVLQRISIDWLKKMLKDTSKVMKKDAIFWHKIDCNDINAMYDKKITRYQYLKYSDRLWKLMTSEVFNNQNRLRQSDFIKSFNEVGFKPIFVRSQHPKNYKKQLKSIKINKRFKHYKFEDLSITNFIIYAGRGRFIKNIDPIYELHSID